MTGLEAAVAHIVVHSLGKSHPDLRSTCCQRKDPEKLAMYSFSLPAEETNQQSFGLSQHQCKQRLEDPGVYKITAQS